MWLRARDRAGRAMLSGTLRVEERSLRRRELDILPSLLARIDELQAKQPALVQVDSHTRIEPGER